MRILVVDDNEELRGFLVLLLKEADFEAVAARDSTDALQKVAAEKFDILIIDSVMDGVDGIDLVRQIREIKRERSLPIVLMSTISTSLARRMATDAGCSDFLVKPFGPVQLIEQIKKLG